MTTRCVLVIDDGQVVDETIDCLRNKLDAEVLIEHQGQAGIRRAKEILPDLILIDSSLTDADGFGICDRIRKDQELKDTPMVIIVSDPEQASVKAARNSPSIILVQAPISSKELTMVCKKVLCNPNNPRSTKKVLPALSDITALKKDPLRTSTDSKSHKVKFAMRGYLNMVSTGEVLQLLKHKAHSGLLRITSGKVRLDVFINKGDIAFARSHAKHEEFLLGRFLVEIEALQPEDLDKVVDQGSDNQLLIGERLVQLGHITRKQLNESIRRQTESLVYESLRWQEGEFLFFVTTQMPREVRDTDLMLSVDHVLMEGFQRVYEWSMIENEIKNLDTVLIPVPESRDLHAQIESLKPSEKKILDLVDGYRSVKEIVRLSRRSSFDVCSTLFRLLSLKVISKNPP